MIEIKPQFIKTATDELVVITRGEFDALVAGLAATDEDADDVAIFDARMSDLAAGSDARLPAEVTAAMLRGDSLLKAVRKWKDITQAHLAIRTHLAQGYISDLESGRKRGTPETLRLIAEALGVDPRWIIS